MTPTTRYRNEACLSKPWKVLFQIVTVLSLPLLTFGVTMEVRGQNHENRLVSLEKLAERREVKLDTVLEEITAVRVTLARLEEQVRKK